MSFNTTARHHYDDRLTMGANFLTEIEWMAIAAFLPTPGKRGRPRTTDLRLVLDAILYMEWTGCQWRVLQPHIPPISTVRRDFYAGRDSGLLRTINFHLVQAARETKGIEASPTASIIDSQSARITDVAGPRSVPVIQCTIRPSETMMRRALIFRRFLSIQIQPPPKPSCG